MQGIEITGAKKNNLKNISLKIPRRQLITITGVSGSGKSTLAYDTLFQEGQRRYLESLSTYARQFIKAVEKPEVHSVRGISPTISIDQKHASFYYNSTVGTISEVSQYLRLLFARAAEAYCPGCGKQIQRYSLPKILDYVFDKFSGELIYILAPVVRNRKGNYRALFEKYLKRGFLKSLVDGKLYYLDSVPALDRNTRHNISIQIDAAKIEDKNRSQVKESVALSGFESNGEIIVLHDNKEYFFSNKLYCPECNISLEEPQPATFSLNSPVAACDFCSGRGTDEENKLCRYCSGTGFKKESLSFHFKGKNIFELGEMEVIDLLEFFKELTFTREEEKILSAILPQVAQRLESFIELNLGYITLNRKINTLSGGELQRTRLVSQIGFGLSGIIYILDEPSIGMHMAELENLLHILKKLKEKDNTIIVVEHDESTIRASDYIVDLGPGSGDSGGNIVYSGNFRDFHKAKDSLTAAYLFPEGRGTGNNKRSATAADKARQKFSPDNSIEIKGITLNNLTDVAVTVPLKALSVVTGVSGSGKSSLIMDAFYTIVKNKIESVIAINKQNNRSGKALPKAAPTPVLDNAPAGDGMVAVHTYGNRKIKYRAVKGITGEGPARILTVDQSAIGKNSRSCPATYINVMPLIRELFAGLTEAKMRGYKQSRFSFNVSGGRCEACNGLGIRKLEMSFLPQLEIKCPVCEGKRYNSETLLCKYKGLSIADVLALTAAEAYTLFRDIPMLAKKIKVLADVGLGYLQLGQSSTTLSGGESQRIRISKELGRISSLSTIYLFDEPTIGLHFADIEKLLNVFAALTAKGNTVIVIEHNMDIIRAADYIIDMGPGGGKNGGEILYQGNLQGILKNKKSITARYLE
jgi:excinuclease ABC subunit A